MKRKLLFVVTVAVLWSLVLSVRDSRRAKRRQELWAEATRDNASR